MSTPHLVRRRTLLQVTGAAAAAIAGGLALPGPASAETPDSPTFVTTPFTVGVASGDALPDAVVIWTRLALAPTAVGQGMDGIGSVPVRWQVARTTDGLRSGDLVAAGTAQAEAAYGWSVHVDVPGLHPDTSYAYRFLVGDWISPVGLTRTAPVPSADTDARFAVVSCENLAKPGSGVFYFNGDDDIARRNDLDFVVFLGDYIYEFGRPGHIPARGVVSLDDYRRRYGQYKSRDALLALHARFPVYVVPDDHEFFDNVLGGDPNLSESDRQRFSNALQVFWENMPLRGGPPVHDASSGRGHLVLQRQVRWGRHLDLLLVDDRQWRTPTSTILGEDQMAWLLDKVAGSRSTWTAIGSGVPLSWFPGFPGAADKWTGYEADRSALTDALAARLAARGRRAFNPVVLSGDVHRGIVTMVRQRQSESSVLVATEFVGPPLTSNSSTDFTRYTDPGAFRAEYVYGDAGQLSSYRGYLDCTVDATSWTTAYVLGNQVERPDGTVSVFDRWRVEAGAPVGSVRRL
ncbi:alkaline phosphatase D family protein [Actinopolymorpha rutila]|uniref:Alkaline phosphatase D n=1 Tax=Actinopolymorpha rutila TaxID=446787 RepID=A0A852ZD87_9ACTN|nr:alkaline phosphatase D family protein [Actinopolymorpha rutila]NYH90854.1 alkaline phosphatase D [Actinopolymorpha rutila]